MDRIASISKDTIFPMKKAESPNLLIVGAQKSGTTALLHNLNKHSDVQLFTGKNSFGQSEIEFFNQHWDLGVDWYLKHFSYRTKITGEKTAELLHRTVCHPRIKAVLPNVKLLITLREPVSRTFSQWRMAYFDKKDEPHSFEDAIKVEIENFENEAYTRTFYNAERTGVSNWREGYILKSLYHRQIESVFRHFKREQVLVLFTEALLQDPHCCFTRIFEFLEIAPQKIDFENYFMGKGSPHLNGSTRRNLEDLFRYENEKLFNLLELSTNPWT